MAWNDSNEIVVAGTGQVYVAPTGTALPTTGPDQKLNSAFVGLGYHTEDGTTFTVSPDITEFLAWQSRQPIRRDLKAQDLTVAFQLQQWNEENVPLAFGGGEITEVSAGIYRYSFPEEGDALDERALVLDVQDGERKMRFVLPKGNVTESVESQFQRSETAKLPITFKALAADDGGSPGYMLFNDAAAFAAGS
jgi:hypothetical protein